MSKEKETETNPGEEQGTTEAAHDNVEALAVEVDEHPTPEDPERASEEESETDGEASEATVSRWNADTQDIKIPSEGDERAVQKLESSDASEALVENAGADDAADDADDDMDKKFDEYWDAQETQEAEGGDPPGEKKRPRKKTAVVLPEPAENPDIPLELLDQDALWVVRRLRVKGYEAYLTGGCVRDLLLGRTPKDFDVATAAHPNQVKRVFRNCRLVGRRFRLAHILFPGGKIIETATFRTNPLETMDDLPEDLLVERDNVFGTVEEDARRRDLTINGLFYDPIEGRVLDFVDGKADIENKIIRTIGDPKIRFAEDPVRMIRAIKFATRLGFEIEATTREAIQELVGELVRCAPARLFEEITRLLGSGHAAAAMSMCEDLGVLETLLPELGLSLNQELKPAPVVPNEEQDGSSEAQENRPEEHESEEPSTAASDVEEDKPVTSGQNEEPQLEEPEAAEGANPVEGSDASEHSDEPSDANDLRPAPAPAVPLAPPASPDDRKAQYVALLEALDDARSRKVELTNAIMFSAMLYPSWEALRLSDQDESEWLRELGTAWSERFRLTRNDKETMRILLTAQQALDPSRRQTSRARSLVGRPWFRDALLLHTLCLWSQKGDLAEVGKWKVVAKHFDKPYVQPKAGKRVSPPRRSRRSRSGGRRFNGNRKRR